MYFSLDFAHCYLYGRIRLFFCSGFIILPQEGQYLIFCRIMEPQYMQFISEWSLALGWSALYRRMNATISRRRNTDKVMICTFRLSLNVPITSIVGVSSKPRTRRKELILSELPCHFAILLTIIATTMERTAIISSTYQISILYPSQNKKCAAPRRNRARKMHSSSCCHAITLNTSENAKVESAFLPK